LWHDRGFAGTRLHERNTLLEEIFPDGACHSSSTTGKYDQIVPPFYTQEFADLIPAVKRAEIPSGHLSFLEKPVDLASAILTLLLKKHP
jgi:pimeloyl-ACP methyl ester carboxylesterase